MYVPLLTPWLNARDDATTNQRPRRGTARRLERRRGGGGRGGGGGGGGGKGGSSGGGRSVPVSNAGGKGTASAYGNGGGKASPLPAGNAFAGRTAGGGTRGEVYGTRTYGSGYPGVGGYGVAGRGFPFYFWPVTFGGLGGLGGYGYYHNREYGDSNNASRPGGPMTTLTFQSANPSDPNNSTFHVLADNSTSASLLTSIYESCSSLFTPSSPSTSNNSLPMPLNDTDVNSPKPEQAVQFYRASSVALTLDGYNNSAALSAAVTSGNASAESVQDTPLPERYDANLLDCLNTTIGDAVPLIDGASARWAPTGGLGGLGLVWIAWYLLGGL